MLSVLPCCRRFSFLKLFQKFVQSPQSAGRERQKNGLNDDVQLCFREQRMTRRSSFNKNKIKIIFFVTLNITP